ncbi:hypothetical protein EVAR_10493_1 [Eumeta japonica]|uniref:Uncharacterized protein n=1 Tax=Eumeta variegata TaxID=151549 RepID=A0A4C1TKG4_EUMVA|nr:hypothetical protein EVAR_10493_1 [Eumeta japonica]
MRDGKFSSAFVVLRPTTAPFTSPSYALPSKGFYPLNNVYKIIPIGAVPPKTGVQKNEGYIVICVDGQTGERPDGWLELKARSESGPRAGQELRSRAEPKIGLALELKTRLLLGQVVGPISKIE